MEGVARTVLRRIAYGVARIALVLAVLAAGLLRPLHTVIGIGRAQRERLSARSRDGSRALDHRGIKPEPAVEHAASDPVG